MQVEYMGSEREPSYLKPTELSRAAVLYNAERKKLSDGTTEPKWTEKSVLELKKKCEAQQKQVENLEVLDGRSSGKPFKLWTRLTGLAQGLGANKELVAPGP
jgi:hypothetical protein